VTHIENVPPPPRRRHGCLWGCVGILVLAAALIAAFVSYSDWFFSSGYKSNPQIQTALTVVRGNTVAHAVLGDAIAMESVESETLTAVKGHGKTVAYTIHLKGSRAEGRLHVMFHSDGKKGMTIVSMILTGPDDQRYNLTSSGSSGSANSI
jgi:hypothetical protein